MNRILFLFLLIFLSGCYSSLNDIKKESELLIEKHQISLLKIMEEFDNVVKDSSQIYSLHTSVTTDYWSLSQLCRSKNDEIIHSPSNLVYEDKFRNSIQKLIPKKDISNVYFKKHFFIGFGIRGVRNHNLEFQKIFYFNDSSSVPKLFTNIKKINVDDISNINSDTEIDLLVFHNEHWAFTAADSLFQKAKFNCKEE